MSFGNHSQAMVCVKIKFKVEMDALEQVYEGLPFDSPWMH